MDDVQNTELVALRRQLEELKVEHRDLDDAIEALAGAGAHNHLQIQRLKKRKLMLKDQITRIESMMLPDIIA
ncbi:MAG: DUF465 domain-containing protein [Alphaproteobacteria bacterium]|nr:DUF465 domain-containing protein [Alphaproteobacteria bacterium]MCW5752563.1 DUF465 domain-containing protein [Alphaproteobacteria bacterium]